MGSEDHFLFVCLVLFFLYSERLLSQRKLLGPKQGGFMPPTYLVGPWLYLIHILVDWPFVACWKAIKAMTARMTALQVHPFSFPSLLSSETDIIRKSNAMAAGVPASFFLSFFFFLLDFTSLFHPTTQAHYIPVHSPTTPQWAHIHQWRLSLLFSVFCLNLLIQMSAVFVMWHLSLREILL